MAGSSLLTLLDDIATVLDDIALMSKIAAKKTAGVLGDDLALNAQQVSGVRAEREIPVVWAVAKGSFKNKLILVPAALLISVIAPWLITPLLMLGGAFLCFEGFEKIAQKLFHSDEEKKAHGEVVTAFHDSNIEMLDYEKNKIKGAIRTDFILSSEIIVIALGTVKDSAFITQVSVVSVIAIVMTIGVYGFVAGIVKIDDAGFYLIKETSKNIWGNMKRAFGRGLLAFAPFLMKSLSIVGTAAMFLVGGGILVHGFPYVANQEHNLEHWAESIPSVGNIIGPITPMIYNAVFGLIVGAVLVAIVSLYSKIKHIK